MKEIIIESKVHGTHIVQVDDEDYEELSKYKWYLAKGKHTFYVHRDASIHENGKRVKKITILMHRQIMGLQSDDKRLVDHIDGCGTNNQKINLRICTATENNRNRVHSRGDFASQYKGVYWDRQRCIWVASIRVDKKDIHLGRYKNEEDVAKVYDWAAIKYFKEFACVNLEDSIGKYDELNIYVDTIRKVKKPNASKYTYIWFSGRYKKWGAQVNRRNIGFYDTEDEAYNARQEYVKLLNEENK